MQQATRHVQDLAGVIHPSLLKTERSLILCFHALIRRRVDVMRISRVTGLLGLICFLLSSTVTTLAISSSRRASNFFFYGRSKKF